MAKRMTARLRRVVFLDRLDDYTEGDVFHDFAASVDHYMSHRHGAFRIIFRGEGSSVKDNVSFAAWLELLSYTQQRDPGPPVALVVEESGMYSTAHDLPEIVQDLYLYGRRWGIQILSVVQRDVQVHPIVRANTQLFVGMQNRKQSADMRELFPDDWRRFPTLVPLRPQDTHVYGRHYLTSPPDVDPVKYWGPHTFPDFHDPGPAPSSE